MWLARWFGGRKVQVEDRPARIAPRVCDTPVPPVKRSPRKGASAAKSGFDPYNSGSFERGNAWERVIRR